MTVLEFSIQRLRERRTLVMGIAALMIYFAHVYSYADLGTFGAFFTYANWGVDVFLLVSGFGICHSMAKCPIAREFYWKRLVKVGVPYLVLAVPFYFASDTSLPSRATGGCSCSTSLRCRIGCSTGGGLVCGHARAALPLGPTGGWLLPPPWRACRLHRGDRSECRRRAIPEGRLYGCRPRAQRRECLPADPVLLHGLFTRRPLDIRKVSGGYLSKPLHLGAFSHCSAGSSLGTRGARPSYPPLLFLSGFLLRKGFPLSASSNCSARPVWSPIC